MLKNQLKLEGETSDGDIIVDTDEDDRRLDLLHQNVRKYGTISNTVAATTKLEGKIVRAGTV